MSNLIIREMKGGYAARTRYNARRGNVTAAFAVDFTTRGEQLTRRACEEFGNIYVPVQLFVEKATVAAKRIIASLPLGGTLNVAGNGLYTLRGYTQEMCNDYLFQTLFACVNDVEIIYTGGQTGVDLAGARAGYKLGIRTIVTLPEGFLQRNAEGVDETHTKAEIEAQVCS